MHIDAMQNRQRLKTGNSREHRSPAKVKLKMLGPYLVPRGMGYLHKSEESPIQAQIRERYVY